jgi:sulfoxide reductase heme-binding subunit YedZ
MSRDPMDYGWWLASRASGLVALALITLSVGVGLAMAGRAFQTPGLARRLMATHEHAALAGLIAIAVHGITLLGDTWLDPGPAGIAVPFVMDYEPLYTGLGIAGGYLAAALGPSFYARRRIGAKLWRKLHRVTIVVYVLAVIHTLGAGSDAQEPWLRAAMLVTGAPILYLLVVRLLPAPQRRRTRTGTSAVPGAS